MAPAKSGELSEYELCSESRTWRKTDESSKAFDKNRSSLSSSTMDYYRCSNDFFVFVFLFV
jgi:hypothetical protein